MTPITVTRYRTDDGRTFDDPAEALRHERLTAAVADILAPLGDRPPDPDCRFANGHGYLQHDPATVREMVAKFVKLARVELPQLAADHPGTFDPAIPPARGLLGWMLDGDSLVLHAAWSRLACINDDGREWGQPYYALNPGKAEAFEIARG